MDSNIKYGFITGFIGIFFLCGVIVFIYFIYPPSEVVIERIIKSAKEGVHDKEISKTIAHLSPAYTDEIDMSYSKWSSFFQNLYNSFDEIDVNISDLTIQVDGNHGVASFNLKVRISGKHAQFGLYRDDFLFENLKLIFEKNGGKWLIIRSQGLESRNYIEEFL